ncbi:DMT family transporter [Paraburkholderia sp. XV]|uniref:DMT family transporter n=1 Tax=Paraburkholderia sp. XV TaxID=2831520 RepID=UPI002970021E|nr:SMR family transporter [Paraburkholderia sp. XV]
MSLSILAICDEVTATSFMKQSYGFTKLIPSLVTGAGYVTSFYFLSLTLRTVPTGVAYAIWSGVGVVLITIIAWRFQGQKLDIPAPTGMALIVIGVVTLNLFSSSTSH